MLRLQIYDIMAYKDQSLRFLCYNEIKDVIRTNKYDNLVGAGIELQLTTKRDKHIEYQFITH